MSSYEPPADQNPPPSGYGETPPPPPPPAPPGSGAYSVGTAWRYGWDKFTSNLGQILLAVLLLVLVQIVVQGLSYLVSDAYVIRWLFSVAAWILSMIIGAGIIRGALDITEGRRLDPATLLKPRKLGEVIVASVL